MNVTIYTMPECEHCKEAKEYLKANDIEYIEKDVFRNKENAREMIEKSGRKVIPVIDIDGNIVVGFEQDQIEQLLGI
ncbi:MAG: NrdH-redoxin [Clostridiales bacterium]|nr:NrdH-redoxin [Clostridiales bacterium]